MRMTATSQRSKKSYVPAKWSNSNQQTSVINMAWIASVVAVAASCLVTPFLMFMLCIIFLASIGKSLGVRRLYVKILLMIFEYGRAEVAENRSRIIDYSPESDEEETIANNPLEETNKKNINEKNEETKIANGAINHDNNLISRNNLILAPDPSLNVNVQNNHTNKKESSPQREDDDESSVPTEQTLEKDFTLTNCLDYVKAGVEAIIEDQVTSRFEAEELKNWNLLTRTNRHYEFISWKLTVIWMCGFFIRYFFLFPLRVLICFIGVIWMVFSTFVIGYLPDSSFKRWINKRAFVMTFRIMARSLSAVLTFHNREYMPNKGGVCVANHTTPIDVMFLSTESCFSLVMWLTLCTALVGYVPEGNFKSWLNRNVSIMCFGVLSSALSSVITYHNSENRPKNGICVANHTSPIDVLVLMCDNCYSLIGQRHGGFLGILQRALARASPHIWFERSEVKDRHAVANRLKKHVSNPKNPPILIFPEGTCINNTSVMQFKKGSFEVGSVIYPVAIKYDPKFGDAFWNSSKYSMMQYLYMMMTSWAIVCDVWYLPPMYQKEGETAIDFANRVKGVIAKQGGLVDLMWDGQLKRMKPKKEWKEKQQEEFSKLLVKMD